MLGPTVSQPATAVLQATLLKATLLRRPSLPNAGQPPGGGPPGGGGGGGASGVPCPKAAPWGMDNRLTSSGATWQVFATSCPNYDFSKASTGYTANYQNQTW
jgi:hypothetical protein